MRMALHSGEVVAGDMGSPLKSNYTVVGQPVATAARLERANRLYGTQMLASGETVRRVGTEFVFRELDTVTIGSGVETLYELISKRGEVPPALAPILEGWPEALARARRRDFTGALAFFEAHAAVDPVSAAWAERVHGYIAHPPPEGWTGRGDLRGGG
jgi:adenylate cyclase